jgi:hypothetical protein
LQKKNQQIIENEISVTAQQTTCIEKFQLKGTSPPIPLTNCTREAQHRGVNFTPAIFQKQSILLAKKNQQIIENEISVTAQQTTWLNKPELTEISATSVPHFATLPSPCQRIVPRHHTEFPPPPASPSHRLAISPSENRS